MYIYNYIYIHIIDAKMATGSIFFEFQLLLHDSRKSMCVAITHELRVVTLLVIGQPRSLVSSVWGMAYSLCSALIGMANFGGAYEACDFKDLKRATFNS
jgi:hypothetical protein